MMTTRCLEGSTLVRWCRFLVPLVALLVAPSICAQTLADLTRAYLDRKTAANKKALLDYAGEHQNNYTGSLALLVVGATLAESERGWEEGAEHLAAAAPNLVRLTDYIGYYSAVALYEQRKDPQAVRALDPVINGKPVSPLRPEAVMLAATIYYEAGQPDQSISLIQSYFAELPPARALSLLADAQVKVGNRQEAAGNYQRVYYQYPLSPDAKTAASQLSALRKTLGTEYPPATAALLFQRVDRLIEGGEHETARTELQSMTESLAGADRDRARVWLGKARYIRRDDDVAYRWLSQLRVTDQNAEAERLYWLLEASRRLGGRTNVARTLKTMEEKFHDSGWRLQALVSAGNMHLLANNHQEYLPIFGACADGFISERDAAYCHWKVSWSHYIRRLPQAAEFFRAHLEKFPASEYVPAALYFLGRLAEKDADQASARAWYGETVFEFPNHYYGALSRERLAWKPIAAAAPSPDVTGFLRKVALPDRQRTLSFEETEISRIRKTRAELLTTAGLYEWAENELYFAARTEGDGPVLALELARLATRRQDYGKSIRYVKGLAPNYLDVALDSAPAAFWRLAFPLPYREELEKHASQQQLDPFFFAALIRQESEFDTRARSRAGALGLTQVLPATGRQMYRSLGYSRWSADMLYEPEINLNMGTHWFRQLIDGLDGHTEAALAAYNAGRSRAVEWLKWGEFREPAEFVETVPFTETRDYIRAVLRNADLYRRIYQ